MLVDGVRGKEVINKQINHFDFLETIFLSNSD